MRTQMMAGIMEIMIYADHFFQTPPAQIIILHVVFRSENRAQWSSTNMLRRTAARTASGTSAPRRTFVGNWCPHHCPRNCVKNTMSAACPSVRTMKCRQVFTVFCCCCVCVLLTASFFFILGCTWSLQEQHSRQGYPGVQKKIRCVHRTHPAWEDQRHKCSSWHSLIEGKHRRPQALLTEKINCCLCAVRFRRLVFNCQAENGQGSQGNSWTQS